MAATRHDHGNPWVSCAQLNDDRTPIVAKAAKLVGALFVFLS